MRQIRYSVHVGNGPHHAELRTIDHSLASWFLKEMAKRLMEQIEAEYPKTTVIIEKEKAAQAQTGGC